jgi:formate dehydrogenase major subunit
MLIKRTGRQARNRTLADALQIKTENNVDRRAFLRRSGLVAGGLAAVGALPLSSVRKSEAAHPRQRGAEVTIRKSICTFCSVGCTVLGEVSDALTVAVHTGIRWFAVSRHWLRSEALPRARLGKMSTRALRCPRRS